MGQLEDTTSLVFLTCSHPTPSHCQAYKVGLVQHHCGFLAAGSVGGCGFFLVVSLCNSGSFERGSGRNTWKQKGLHWRPYCIQFKARKKPFHGERSRGGDGRAFREVQPPHSGQKREFCGCPTAVTGWDARKGCELTPCCSQSSPQWSALNW